MAFFADGTRAVIALVVVGLLASMAGLEYYFLDSGTFIPFCLSWGAGAGLAAGVLGALTPMLSCRSTITRHRKVCGRCCDGKFMAEFCVDLRDGVSSLVLSLAGYALMSGVLTGAVGFCMLLLHILKFADIYAPWQDGFLSHLSSGTIVMGILCVLIFIGVYARFLVLARDGWYTTGRFLYDGDVESNWKAMF